MLQKLTVISYHMWQWLKKIHNLHTNTFINACIPFTPYIVHGDNPLFLIFNNANENLETTFTTNLLLCIISMTTHSLYNKPIKGFCLKCEFIRKTYCKTIIRSFIYQFSKACDMKLKKGEKHINIIYPRRCKVC